MMKNLMLVAVILSVLVGLSGCCTIFPGKVIYSDQLVEKIGDVGAKATILIAADGSVHVYNEKGDRTNVNKCRLPVYDKKTTKTDGSLKMKRQSLIRTGSLPVCTGMGKDSSVTSIQSLSIMKSNSRECITVGYTAAGHPDEVCWDVP